MPDQNNDPAAMSRSDLISTLNDYEIAFGEARRANQEALVENKRNLAMLQEELFKTDSDDGFDFKTALAKALGAAIPAGLALATGKSGGISGAAKAGQKQLEVDRLEDRAVRKNRKEALKGAIDITSDELKELEKREFQFEKERGKSIQKRQDKKRDVADKKALFLWQVPYREKIAKLGKSQINLNTLENELQKSIGPRKNADSMIVSLIKDIEKIDPDQRGFGMQEILDPNSQVGQFAQRLPGLALIVGKQLFNDRLSDREGIILAALQGADWSKLKGVTIKGSTIQNMLVKMAKLNREFMDNDIASYEDFKASIGPGGELLPGALRASINARFEPLPDIIETTEEKKARLKKLKKLRDEAARGDK